MAFIYDSKTNTYKATAFAPLENPEDRKRKDKEEQAARDAARQAQQKEDQRNSISGRARRAYNSSVGFLEGAGKTILRNAIGAQVANSPGADGWNKSDTGKTPFLSQTVTPNDFTIANINDNPSQQAGVAFGGVVSPNVDNTINLFDKANTYKAAGNAALAGTGKTLDLVGNLINRGANAFNSFGDVPDVNGNLSKPLPIHRQSEYVKNAQKRADDLAVTPEQKTMVKVAGFLGENAPFFLVPTIGVGEGVAGLSGVAIRMAVKATENEAFMGATEFADGDSIKDIIKKAPENLLVGSLFVALPEGAAALTSKYKDSLSKPIADLTDRQANNILKDIADLMPDHTNTHETGTKIISDISDPLYNDLTKTSKLDMGPPPPPTTPSAGGIGESINVPIKKAPDAVVEGVRPVYTESVKAPFEGKVLSEVTKNADKSPVVSSNLSEVFTHFGEDTSKLAKKGVMDNVDTQGNHAGDIVYKTMSKDAKKEIKDEVDSLVSGKYVNDKEKFSAAVNTLLQHPEVRENNPKLAAYVDSVIGVVNPKVEGVKTDLAAQVELLRVDSGKPKLTPVVNPKTGETLKPHAKPTTPKAKTQGKLYHGGTPVDKNSIDSSDLGFSLSDNKNVAKWFTNTKKNSTITEHVISPNAKILSPDDIPQNLLDNFSKFDSNKSILENLDPSNIKNAERKLVAYARENGYDVIDMRGKPFVHDGPKNVLDNEGELRILNQSALVDPGLNTSTTPTSKPTTPTEKGFVKLSGGGKEAKGNTISSRAKNSNKTTEAKVSVNESNATGGKPIETKAESTNSQPTSEAKPSISKPKEKVTVEDSGKTAEKGVSKAGKDIQDRAVEKNLTKKLESESEDHLAKYDKIEIKEQADRATKLVNEKSDDAIAIMRGEKSPPDGLKGRAVLTALEEKFTREGNGEMLLELQGSSLASETSGHAQELRLGKEAPNDGALAQVDKVKDQKIKDNVGSNKKYIKTVRKDLESLKASIKKFAPTKEDLDKFIEDLRC